ncbi:MULTISPECIES: glutathione S-transferase family protein [Rhizobium/Agrobacterium group]|uniref:Glutathione S-transferase n=1 Tax=Pseudorhizobium tarimense TaxID=1079109 RepID=A0ABV2H5Z6_9HYPH|nr:MULTISPECIES: glutathione S-transferase family protein [Rhizobium/Agrobacterium group]MCF6370581.1 glutathione S-transferase family protein [Rhizobium halophilum]MCJ8519188.1 glutathione S-transferase family protein [Pseudorhizobium tarimense]
MTRVLYSLCGKDETRPFSPHCWKVSLALAHKGLDYVERPYPFTAIPTIEDGFSKTVPILRDGDRLVRDSFDIALYLEETYPDHPTLFGGEGGKALSRFVESFSQMILHMPVTKMAIMHIHDMLDEGDQAYFRQSRLERLGKSIEEVAAEGEAERAAFAARLEPVRRTLHFQPYLGGERPLFADYILFGALQWMRVTAGTPPLAEDDSVMQWFERCLDLYDGLGRRVTAA